MGQPVKFPGVTHDFGPPPGDDGTIGRLPCFMNGYAVVSCWELDDSEIAEILRSRKVWLSVLSGSAVFPVYVGTESIFKQVVADTGKLWNPNHELR